MNLNEKQIEAINSKEKIIRVVAGAGSGKTRVLTERIKKHIKEGINPKSILAITFTNKAANEMKERVNNFDVNISTIHSLCVKILREDWKKKNFRIIDSSEQLEIIKTIEEELFLDEKNNKPQEMLSLVCQHKSKRLKPDFEKPKYQPLRSIYDAYINKLESLNAMDFDDLIINSAEILQNEQIRKKWASRFFYILVDEFQDVDEVQYEVIKYLSSFHGNLFVVGDGDQMIYSWRGSSEVIFNNFDSDFKTCQTIFLNQNYRSTKKILDKANVLIKNNKERIEKDLWTCNIEGDDVKIKVYDTEKDEANAIAEDILKNKDKYKFSETAILYRANYLSKNIESALNAKHIPNIIFGGFRFYDRKEVKDLIAYLKLILYKDDVSLKRIINVPARKIGKAKVKEISELAKKNNISMWDVIDQGLFETDESKEFVNLIKDCESKQWNLIIKEIVDRTDYMQTLEDEEHAKNVETLIDIINETVIDNPDWTLKDFLDNVALEQDAGKNKASDSVQMMTIHSSKGLEFKNVYVIGMSEGKFPKNNDEVEEEERRLAYVAFTRAKEHLTLCSERFSRAGQCAQSIFISEIGGKAEKATSLRKPSWKYWY